MSENQFTDNHPARSDEGISDPGEEFVDLFAELQAFEFGMSPDASPKRFRRTYDDKELERLETVFAANSYPDRGSRIALAAEMNVSPKNIQIWFQNRRARERLLRRKATGVVENPINRMRVQLAQSPHPVTSQQYSLSCENQKPEVMGQCYPLAAQQRQQRPPLRPITCNVQSLGPAACQNQESSLEQVQMDDCSNLQVPLSQIWQQVPEPCTKLHATAVMPGCFRVSLSSISNLSEISNSSFTDLVAAMDGLDEPSFAHLSPNYDFVFDF